MEEKFYYPYCHINYRTFNENCPRTKPAADNLISSKDGQVFVRPMWRMEILGKYYGISIHEYDDNTNYELYDEKLCSCRNDEEEEECHSSYCYPDTFEYYFERLAEIAAYVGCERAEIKCLIKSLIIRYRFYKVKSIKHFPFEEFNQLYTRLTSSKDLEQLRVAERLSRYHAKQLEMFLCGDVQEKIRQVNWVEED